jgi:hypothetical protein
MLAKVTQVSDVAHGPLVPLATIFRLYGGVQFLLVEERTQIHNFVFKERSCTADLPQVN